MTRRKVSRRSDTVLDAVLMLMNIMDAIDICEYRSRYSNHVYTVKQKRALLVLRQFMAISYCEFCDRLPSLTRVCRSLGLDVIPYHSTLAKFSATVDADVLHRMVSGFSAACDGEAVTVVVDSTGFSEMCTSQYFIKRKKDFGVDPEPDAQRILEGHIRRGCGIQDHTGMRYSGPA